MVVQEGFGKHGNIGEWTKAEMVGLAGDPDMADLGTEEKVAAAEDDDAWEGATAAAAAAPSRWETSQR